MVGKAEENKSWMEEWSWDELQRSISKSSLHFSMDINHLCAALWVWSLNWERNAWEIRELKIGMNKDDTRWTNSVENGHKPPKKSSNSISSSSPSKVSNPAKLLFKPGRRWNWLTIVCEWSINCSHKLKQKIKTNQNKSNQIKPN